MPCRCLKRWRARQEARKAAAEKMIRESPPNVRPPAGGLD